MDAPPFHGHMRIGFNKRTPLALLLQAYRRPFIRIKRIGRSRADRRTSDARHATHFLHRLEPQDYTFTFRNLNAFMITDTELKVIATLAMIGLKRMPKNG